jgi:hypothetical protein
MKTDPWHFERLELATQTLSLLSIGPAQALTLFAPRRTGKTEFLLKDLAPLAESKGHRVIYVSFWQAPLSPLAVLMHALELSLKRGTFSDKVRSTALAVAPKLTLSAPLPGAGVDATIDLTALDKKPPSELLLYLDDLLDRVSKKRKATILMLDEVQELASTPNNDSLVAALRTSLDKRSDRLKAVFTGSSREGLAAMFNARQAPFFHFATPLELPHLDESFVDHLLNTFKKSAKRVLNRKEMVAAFDQLHRNPYFFRKLLEILLLNTQLNIIEAVSQVRYRIAMDLGYPKTWIALTPMQRATALALASGIGRPYSQASRNALGKVLNEDSPTAARVQAALRKLNKLGLADTYTGEWTLDDPEFVDWIKENQ